MEFNKCDSYITFDGKITKLYLYDSKAKKAYSIDDLENKKPGSNVIA